MSKFKAGDRVRCIRPLNGNVVKGQEYIVKGGSEVFDDIVVLEGNKRLCEDRFELVIESPKFKVGDRVALIDANESTTEGAILKFTEHGLVVVQWEQFPFPSMMCLDEIELVATATKPSPIPYAPGLQCKHGVGMSHACRDCVDELVAAHNGGAMKQVIADEFGQAFEEIAKDMKKGLAKCECGSESIGYTTHSTWCPRHE